MPLPRLLARINKRVFNPMEIRQGRRPVLGVVGRSSGAHYKIPLDAHKVDDGYVFILMYGPGSDWVKNVLSSGEATLTIAGETLDLASPTVLNGEQAWKLLPADTKPPPGIAKVDDYLHMKTAA